MQFSKDYDTKDTLWHGSYLKKHHVEIAAYKRNVPDTVKPRGVKLKNYNMIEQLQMHIMKYYFNNKCIHPVI